MIGEFASLTGSEITFGITSGNRVELAREEINDAVLGPQNLDRARKELIEARSAPRHAKDYSLGLIY